MGNHTKEYYKEYRERRKQRGEPVQSGTSTNRNKQSKFDAGLFCAWDGEGADIDGEHRYILLQYCTTNGDNGYISNPNGLSGREAMEFLLRIGAKHSNHIHVMFAGSYDATMLLKPFMTPELVSDLWARTTGTTDENDTMTNIDRYRVSYVPRHTFYISDRRKIGRRSILLWDTFGFFQTTFVKACRKWLGDFDTLAMIESQKERRGDFQPSEMDDIRHYCKAECDALVRLMHRLRDCLQTANIKIRRWDGAGAIAGALLAREGVRQYITDTPEEVSNAAEYAYFGGRIELLRYGSHWDSVYHYDINSAYPSAMLHLPDLTDGTWQYTETLPDNYRDSYAMVHVKWNLDAKGYSVYPFPIRDNIGRIYYPFACTSWVWMPEYQSYIDNAAHYEGYVDVLGVWTYHPNNDTRPFAFIEREYRYRQELKDAGDKAENVIKLGLNSLYGKMAQQIGGKSGRRPPFFQLEYAGYITSYTRAKLYNACMQAPHSVIFMATDGIYSTVPLTLDVSDTKELGKWEYSRHDALVIAQSGVYYVLDGDEWSSYSRGFSTDYEDNGAGLSRERIAEAWEEGKQLLDVAAKRQFIGIGSVAAKQHPYEHLATWQATTKKLVLCATGKRYNIQGPHAPNKQLVPTIAAMGVLNYFDMHSRPHVLTWKSADNEREDKYTIKSRVVNIDKMRIEKSLGFAKKNNK